MSDPNGPITKGPSFNFFKKTTVTNAAFPSTCDINFGFRGNATLSRSISFSLVNEGSAVVEYSFDGINLHGDLTPSTPTAAIMFDNRRVSRIWFRTVTPGQAVRVEAWAL